MSNFRKISSVASFIVLAGGALLFTATAASADAPTSLPAITLTPNPVATTGSFTAEGSGCIGTGGELGDVSIAITYPDGHIEVVGDAGSSDTAIEVGDGGTWSQIFTPGGETGAAANAAVPPGSYTISASCDIYNTTVNYPAASLQVNAVVDNPTATVNKTVVNRGTEIVVGAKGFAGGALITATLDNASVQLGTMTANENGAASATLTIPANTTPGTHTIVLTSADGTTASVTITVKAPVVTVVVSASGPYLANTGTDASAMGAIAVGLLALGGAAAFAGRRKQDA